MGGCVRIGATIRGFYRRLARLRRAWASRLRRDRASVALLALLTLGVGEPLLCIIHCQVWLPIALHSYFAAQHTHHHHGLPVAADQATPGALAPAAASFQPGAAEEPGCLLHFSDPAGSGLPFHVPPSPVHDLLVLLAPLLAIAIIVAARPLAPPGDPPQRTYAPLLRPPIPIAA